MTRYVSRDGNHAEIVTALQQIGVGVIDTAAAGNGFCDIVTFSRGIVRLVEIKDPEGKNRLELSQITAHDLARRHGCAIHVVDSVDAALRLHGARV